MLAVRRARFTVPLAAGSATGDATDEKNASLRDLLILQIRQNAKKNLDDFTEC
jgi:hypothetical protein